MCMSECGVREWRKRFWCGSGGMCKKSIHLYQNLVGVMYSANKNNFLSMPQLHIFSHPVIQPSSPNPLPSSSRHPTLLTQSSRPSHPATSNFSPSHPSLPTQTSNTTLPTQPPCHHHPATQPYSHNHSTLLHHQPNSPHPIT